jgi:hypothetical protein
MMPVTDQPRQHASARPITVHSVGGGSDVSYTPTGFERSLTFQNQSTSEICCKPIFNDVDRAAGTVAATDGIALGAAAAGTTTGQSFGTTSIVEWRFRSKGADNVVVYVIPEER